MENLTLRQAIDLINDLDGLTDPDFREARYQAGRVLTHFEVITPEGAVTRGQTGRYAPETVCMIRLAFALYDAGLERAVVFGLLKTTPAKDTLAAVLDATRKGVSAELVLEIGRVSGQTEPFRLLGWTLAGDDFSLQRRSAIVDSVASTFGLARFNATALFQPVLAALNAGV